MALLEMMEGSTDAFMLLEPFLAAGGDFTREQRTAAHQVELDLRHCTWLRDVSGGTVSRKWRTSLTPEGREWLGKARGELTSLRARRTAACDAVLYWVCEQEDAGKDRGGVTVLALGAYGRFYDQQFTSNEIIEAGRWLLAEGYIEGNTAWGVAVLDPSSTTKGGRMVDERRSVSDPDLTPALGGGTRNTLNNYGTLGSAQQAGESSAQFAAATFTKEQRHQVLSVADALGAMRAQLGLNEDGLELAEQVEGELREVASQPAPAPTVVRKALGRAGEVASLATATTLGSAFGVLVQHAVSALGLG